MSIEYFQKKKTACSGEQIVFIWLISKQVLARVRSILMLYFTTRGRERPHKAWLFQDPQSQWWTMGRPRQEAGEEKKQTEEQANGKTSKQELPRPGRAVTRTAIPEHSFPVPFQISWIPSGIVSRFPVVGLHQTDRFRVGGEPLSTARGPVIRKAKTHKSSQLRWPRASRGGSPTSSSQEIFQENCSFCWNQSTGGWGG